MNDNQHFFHSTIFRRERYSLNANMTCMYCACYGDFPFCSNRPFARSGHMVQNMLRPSTRARTQVGQWDFQNKGRSKWTGTSCFVWKSHMCSVHSRIVSDFVPCDPVVQSYLHIHFTLSVSIFCTVWNKY